MFNVRHNKVILHLILIFGLSSTDLIYGNDSNKITPPIQPPSDLKCYRVLRTLGVEWEVAPINKAANTYPYDLLFENQLFTSLFSFYGRNPNGNMEEHFIPDFITTHSDWQSIRHNTSIQIEDVKGGVLIKNFSTLKGKSLEKLIIKTFQIRGRNSESLLMKKSSLGWKNASYLDQLISDEVSEEWRGINYFAGLEFTMNGGVESRKIIEAWFKNLWWRLGFIEQPDPSTIDYFSNDLSHVHWRISPVGLPDSVRKIIYLGAVGFWGDRNDSSLIHEYARLLPKDRIGTDGTLSYKPEDNRLTGAISLQAINYSIGPLVRSIFNRILVDHNGIYIKGRMNDLDRTIDHSIPPAFKRLSMGLRGGVGVSQVNNDGPIVTINLEARTAGESTAQNIEALPPLIPGTHFVDLNRLAQYSSNTPRGLIDDVTELKAQAKTLGVTEFLVSEAYDQISKDEQKMSPENQPFRWQKNQILAVTFIPLNNWLEHPLVILNLSKMTEPQRLASIQRYNKAFERYRQQVTELYKARINKNYDYFPDWMNGPRQFSNGTNRFFPQGPVTELKYQTYSTDVLLLSGLEMEMFRFIAESGLADLLKF